MKIFFFLLLPFCFQISASEEIHLKIHLFCDANGKGLERDRDVLIKELTALNCEVEWYENNDNGKISYADINIFVQHINNQYLHSAPYNWFIPNPEWYFQDLELLDSMDLILCRTKEIERIFKDRNKKTYYLGFTTPDRYQPKIKKIFPLYLHVAGTSEQKGTSAIRAAWRNHLEFPHLTILKQFEKQKEIQNLNIISHYLSDESLLELQNLCVVHLALSETEGFGHCIMEAMSVKAVVITTDAPPMNEFIQDTRFLVPYDRFSNQWLGTNFYVNSKALEKTIIELQKLSKHDLEVIGNLNRKRYLEMSLEFTENLKNLIDHFIQNNPMEMIEAKG